MTNIPLTFYRSLQLTRTGQEFNDFKIDKKRELYELNSNVLDSIEVTQQLTPQLYRSKRTLLEDLSLENYDIRFFIYASSELQASCLALNPTSAVIRISSSFIDLLNENEIKFIIGHELGHLLFQHHGCSSETSNNHISRLQELSCDRIGLLACGSLHDAISTMIKSSSGLGNKHLEIDVSYYIDQVNKIDQNGHNARELSTHPAWLIRARSLVHFQAILPHDKPQMLCLESLDRVNNQILKEINEFTDYNIIQLAEDTYENTLFWLIAVELLDQGRLSKSHQSTLTKRFGKNKVNKLIAMLKNNTRVQVQKICQRNVDQYKREMEETTIMNFENCVREAQDLLKP